MIVTVFQYAHPALFLKAKVTVNRKRAAQTSAGVE